MDRFLADLLDRDPLLKPGEVARLVGVHPKTVSRWANEGRIPALRTPSGHRRFRRSAVQVLLSH